MPACCPVPNFPCTTLHVASPPTRSYGVMLIGMSQVSSMDVDFHERGQSLLDRTPKVEVRGAGALQQIGAFRGYFTEGTGRSFFAGFFAEALHMGGNGGKSCTHSPTPPLLHARFTFPESILVS